MFSGCVFRTLKNAQRFCVAHAQEQPSADTWRPWRALPCLLGPRMLMQLTVHEASSASLHLQVRSNEHPMWRAFLKTLSPEYKIPERQRIWSLIKELDEAISCKLRELLSDASQMWFLTSDGATSKGEGLLSIDCRNSHGDCYHLALINGEWRKQDAVWIKQQLTVAHPVSQHHSEHMCLLEKRMQNLQRS